MNATLTERQKYAWALLESIRLQQQIEASNLDGMQWVMRLFALEIIRQQADATRIIAGNQTLIKFPTDHYRTREEYLNHHSTSGTWGEDAILFPALEALGYQPVMHLKGIGAYVPFMQSTDKPMQINIVNTGDHWKLKWEPEAQIKSAGNCMYYTMAQQVQKNLTSIQPHIKDKITETTQILKAIESTNTVEAPATKVSSTATNNVVKDIEKEFKDLEEKDQQLYKDSKKMLQKFDIPALLDLYDKLEKSAGNDTYRAKDGKYYTYLKGRSKEVTKEYEKIYKDKADFFENAIDKRIIASEFEKIIHKELVHALAKEAWRSHKSCEELMRLLNSKTSLPFKTKTSTESKSCAEEYRQEEAQHTGKPQHKFKPPRLVK